MQSRRIAIPGPAERRIRREARSATLREIALRLRREGKTLAAIAAVLGVSLTRAFQMVRKAERLRRAEQVLMPTREDPFVCKEGSHG
jgi:hypothetical protein